MRKAKKGFTLLELMLVLALLVIVLGVVYPFFTSNTKTLNETEVKSQLQQEGAQIIESITNNLMSANSIMVIEDVGGANCLDNSACRISIMKLSLLDSTSTNTAEYSIGANIKLNEEIHTSSSTKNKELSTNIDEVNVESIDGKSFRNTKAIKVTVSLSKKAGGRDIKNKISTNIRFRN